TQIALAVIGAVFIVIGLIVPYRISKKLTKTKLLTFQNPDGEVTVSVTAIESYIKRIAQNIHGITDIKSTVKLGKRGIDLICQVSMSSGKNIPEITERIQMEVKNKLRAMLGIEEDINIKMHINKIMQGPQIDETGFQEDLPETDNRQIPYREIE
ncbi:MAG: alkaline shock response membrane anchor protein AmaP, partial [Candidatus Omnitrophota bacterium]